MPVLGESYESVNKLLLNGQDGRESEYPGFGPGYSNYDVIFNTGRTSIKVGFRDGRCERGTCALYAISYVS